MGVTPGMTVGIGATEEEAFVASISGWTIILDNVSMKSDEYMAPTKAGRDETIERNAEEKRDWR
jgi:hypothetical protein